jgi:anti-anti-sigma factor
MHVETRIDDATFNVRMSDRMTFSDHIAFRELLQKVEQSGARSCVLDLSGLISIDSAGLGMLVIAKETAAKQGWSLIVRGPQGHVKALLELGRFERMLTIEP